MKKKILFMLILLTVFRINSVFSQEFYYSFINEKIYEYLSKNKAENPFNTIIIVDSFDEYNCYDNYGNIKYNSSTSQYIYESGKIASEEETIDNIRIVKQYYFNSDSVFSINEYKDFKLLNIKFIDRKGKQLDIGTFKNGNGQLKYYRQNLTISAVENFQNGKLNGDVVLYYSNGSKMLECKFKDGEKVDNCKEYLIEQ